MRRVLDNKESFRLLVKCRRMMTPLTQEELSQKIGKNTEFIGELEDGDSPLPSVDTAKRIISETGGNWDVDLSYFNEYKQYTSSSKSEHLLMIVDKVFETVDYNFRRMVPSQRTEFLYLIQDDADFNVEYSRLFKDVDLDKWEEGKDELRAALDKVKIPDEHRVKRDIVGVEEKFMRKFSTFELPTRIDFLYLWDKDLHFANEYLQAVHKVEGADWEWVKQTTFDILKKYSRQK